MVTLIREIPLAPVQEFSKLGKEYLDAHPTPEWKHTNQQPAKKLQDIPNATGTDIDKWVMLLDIWRDLKPGGSLAFKIDTLVQQHFKLDAQTVHRMITYQKGLSAIWLHFISQKYMCQHPEAELRHSNQECALQITKGDIYKGPKSWVHLYWFYKNLPSTRGELATDIRTLFVSHFGGTFKQIVEALELDKHDENSFKSMPDNDEFLLQLSPEAEERRYRQRLDKLFDFKFPELTSFEQTAIFWVGREPRIRMIVAGVTIVAPLAVVFFSTFSLPALLAVAGLMGATFLSLEVVGRTAAKVGSKIPEEVLKTMKDNQFLLGSTGMKFQRSLEVQKGIICTLKREVDTHQINNTEHKEQLKEHKEQLKEHKEQLKEHKEILEKQKEQLANQERTINILKNMAKKCTDSLAEGREQQKILTANIERLSDLNGEFSGEALAHFSGLREEREKLAKENAKLEKKLEIMDGHLKQILKIQEQSRSSSERQEKIAAYLENILSRAGDITFSGKQHAFFPQSSSPPAYQDKPAQPSPAQPSA